MGLNVVILDQWKVFRSKIVKKLTLTGIVEQIEDISGDFWSQIGGLMAISAL